MLRGVYLYTPFHSDFVAKLKALVPSDLRLWEADQKRWYVFETHAEEAVRLARSYWPDMNLDAYDTPWAREEAHKKQSFREQAREQARRSGYGQGRNQWHYSPDGQRKRWKDADGDWGPWQAANQGSSDSGQRASWQGAATSDHAKLYVTADAPAEVIRAAYRALASLNHPDKGGNTETMQSINGAYDRLKKAGKA